MPVKTDTRIIVVLKGADTPRVYASKKGIARGRAEGLVERLDATVAIIYEPDPCPGRDKLVVDDWVNPKE